MSEIQNATYLYIEQQLDEGNTQKGQIWMQILRLLDDEELPLKKLGNEDKTHLLVLLANLSDSEERSKIGRLREYGETLGFD